MKTLYSLVLLITLSSCDNEVATDIVTPATSIKTEIYKSTDDSFQSNFYLKLENETVNLFGWYTSISQDTIYYKTENQLEKYPDDQKILRIDNLEFSRTKTTLNKLDHFKSDTTIKVDYCSSHSSFHFDETIKNRIKSKAVKHSYCSRSDL
jgi:hypothetical protein